jgi:hypothetical protein
MNDATVSGATIPQPAKQARSWRDAMTPLSRASRRRWAAIYPLVLTAVAAISLWEKELGLDGRRLDALWWVALVSLIVVFGMLRRGTRRLAATDHPDLDERDTGARDRAFRLAYPLLMVILVATVTGMVAANHPVDSVGLRNMVLWTALWWVFLPTGVLAWQEPDGLPADPDAIPALSERARDAVFGLALAASLMLALVPAWALALLPLLAVRSILGFLAWRGSGRPLIENARIGRIAFSLVLFGVALGFPATAANDTGVWAITVGLIATGLALGVYAARRS